MSTAKTQQRISFSTVKNRVPYPDLLEVQLKSFRDFFQMDTTAENRKSEGLYKVFQENFPITDTRNNFVLEFIDYYIDPPRYSIEECLERGLTYSVPLKAKLKLYCTDDEHEAEFTADCRPYRLNPRQRDTDAGKPASITMFHPRPAHGSRRAETCRTGPRSCGDTQVRLRADRRIIRPGLRGSRRRPVCRLPSGSRPAPAVRLGIRPQPPLRACHRPANAYKG